MIVPVNDFVVIRPDESLEVSEGGIVLPTVAQEQQHTGIIYAVSETSKFKVGDKILYQKYGAIKLKDRGKDIFVTKEKEIVGVFR